MSFREKYQNVPHIHIYSTPRLINRIRLGSSRIYFVECKICGKLKIKESGYAQFTAEEVEKETDDDQNRQSSSGSDTSD